MKNGILILCASAMMVGCSQQSSIGFDEDELMTASSSVPQPHQPQPRAQPRRAAPPVSKDPKVLWRQRNAQFARMRSWRLQGKVGLRVKAQSTSFNLSWLQQGNGDYEMNIKNPFTGGVVAYLKSAGNQVTLRTTDGKVHKDTNAERLLQQRAGMSLPLKGMRYWARGVSSPGEVVEGIQLDKLGRPTRLQQNGWLITYTGYRDQGPMALPVRMNIARAADKVNVRVIAKDWKTRF